MITSLFLFIFLQSCGYAKTHSYLSEEQRIYNEKLANGQNGKNCIPYRVRKDKVFECWVRCGDETFGYWNCGI